MVTPAAASIRPHVACVSTERTTITGAFAALRDGGTHRAERYPGEAAPAVASSEAGQLQPTGTLRSTSEQVCHRQSAAAPLTSGYYSCQPARRSPSTSWPSSSYSCQAMPNDREDTDIAPGVQRHEVHVLPA